MSSLPGNAVVAQSGGPTAVINASACGVIEEALRHRHAITGLFGANNGILGIVQEDLFDLAAESADAIADYLRQLVTRETGLKARYNKLDTCQRNGIHFASKTDSDEAYRCGQEAVRQALAGATGKMVNLKRVSRQPYRCEPGLVALAEVANGVRSLPREYMDTAGTGISDAMREYAGPLIVGEAPIRVGADGWPVFTRFQRRPIPRKLPPFVGK